MSELPQQMEEKEIKKQETENMLEGIYYIRLKELPSNSVS